MAKMQVWFVAVLASLVQRVDSFVMGIDIGSDFMKVALVQPGRPIEIVTNVESKRKTAIIVAFNDGERLYGGSALNLVPRKPKFCYTGLRSMLGRPIDHPRVKALVEKEYLAAPLTSDKKSGRVGFLHDAGKPTESFMSVESLLGMMLRNAKAATAEFKESNLKDVDVRDVAMTVPSYFTQAEKESLIAAAEIADLKVLGLIDENTAAAVQYARDRSFEDNAQNVLIYNLGADALQVTIAQFSDEVAVEGTTGTIEIKAKTFDTNMGANRFDEGVFNFLCNEFKAKHKVDVRSPKVPKALAKLLKDVPKLTSTLSASKRKPVTIPSFHNEKDLKADLTREKFETFNSALFELVTPSVEKALKIAGMSKGDIDSIEIVGGGVRIPKVQTILSEFFDGKDLNVHLNGDEAFATGSAFHAATISGRTRMKHIAVVDYNPFPIEVVLENADAEAGEWKKQVPIFKAGKRYGCAYQGVIKDVSCKPTTRSIKLKHNQDIIVTFQYKEPNDLPEGSQTKIAAFKITGVAAFAEGKEEKPKVEVNFELDKQGMVKVSGASSGEGDDKTEFDVKRTFQNIPVKTMGEKAMKAVLDQLKAMDEVDAQRVEKATARNQLETIVYKSKMRLTDEEEELEKTTTAEEREALSAKIKEVDDWVEDDIGAEETSVYKNKYKLLEQEVKAFFAKAKATAKGPEEL